MSNIPGIITSSRGGRKLCYKGYIYHRRDSKGDKDYRSCQRKLECKSTAITISTGNGKTVNKEQQNSHAPDQEVVQAELVVNRVKHVAVEHPEVTRTQLMRNELRSVSWCLGKIFLGKVHWK